MVFKKKLRDYQKEYINNENHWYVNKKRNYKINDLREHARTLRLLETIVINPDNDKKIKKEFEDFAGKKWDALSDKKTGRIPLSQLKGDPVEIGEIGRLTRLFIGLKLEESGIVTKYKNEPLLNDFKTKKFTYRKIKNKYKSDEIDSVRVHYRNASAHLQNWGLIRFAEKGKNTKNLYITECGEEYIADVDSKYPFSCNSDSKIKGVFINQVKALQIFSPRNTPRYKQIRVRPYFALAQFLSKLDKDERYFDRQEFTLFITKVISHDDQELTKKVSLLKDFRKLSTNNKTKYIKEIHDLDKSKRPKASQTLYDELYDQGRKTIDALTHEEIHDKAIYERKVINREEFIYVKNHKKLEKEVEQFKSSNQYIEFTTKSDWEKHFGSINGLSIKEIVDVEIKKPRISKGEVKKLVEKYRKKLIDETSLDPKEFIEDRLFERDVESYYEKNIKEILNDKFNLVVEPNGRQYQTLIGPIDLLCKDKNSGSFVVIEFKRGQADDSTIGQITRYMGFIYQHKSKGADKVFGIIVGTNFHERIDYSLQGMQSDEILDLIHLFKHPFDDANKPPKL
jgi:hypothetical protein